MHFIFLLTIAITIISLGLVLFNFLHYYKTLNSIRNHKFKITIKNKSGKEYRIDLDNAKDSNELMNTIDHILH